MQSNFIEIALWHGLFSSKFAAYFQNTFSQERLWVTSVMWQ